MIHGLLKENSQKRSILQSLSQKPHSQQRLPAQLELANMLLGNDEYEEASNYFKRFIKKKIYILKFNLKHC